MSNNKIKNPCLRRILEKELESALDQLYEQDGELLQRDVNERSVSHKLAEYHQQRFIRWNVDCEYNRDGYDKKQLPAQKVCSNDIEATTVFPDIVVHRRGLEKEKHNLLVVEMKKQGRPIAKDEAKLRSFKSFLHYRYAALVIVGPKPYKIKWY